MPFDLSRDSRDDALKVENYLEDLDVRLAVHKISDCGEIPCGSFFFRFYLHDICSHIQELFPLLNSTEDDVSNGALSCGA